MIARNFSQSFSPLTQSLLGTVLAVTLAASAGATTILIDFGSDANTTPTTGGQSWNNVTSAIGTVVPPVGNTSLADLVSTTGSGTGISLTMVSRFGGANTNGTTTGPASYPSSATSDSLYGNTENFTGAGANNFPSFRLAGLVVGQTYDFTFFASRISVGDNRETRYTIAGATSGSVTLNPSNNNTNTVPFSVTPNASGEILISIAPGANNNNTANHFTYLNVLEINTVPEPGSLALAGLGGLLMLRRRR